jgi:hypothetical protein
MEICAGNDPRHLRAVARKLFEKALDGDLSAIREIADRLDGKPVQAIERGDVPVEVLSDYSGSFGARPYAPLDETNRPLITAK